MTIADHTAKLIEQRIAELSDDDFAALVARTRPPSLDPIKQQAADMLAATIGGEQFPTEPATSLTQREIPWDPNAAKPAPESLLKEQAAEAIRNHITNR